MVELGTDVHHKTTQEDLQEMTAYDTKVYRASIDMARAMSVELQSLGVPFFGIPEDKIRVGHQPYEVCDTSIDRPPLTLSTESVDRKELVKLQKKMLELLEDMCKD